MEQTVNNEQPVMTATLVSLIDLSIKVEDRSYNLLLPNGVSYKEVEMVCLEMAKLVVNMQEQAAIKASEEAKAKESESIEPEIVL